MGVQLTKEMIEGAQYTAERYGVPASVTLAQIMLESGGSYEGGLSGLAYKYNNLFGITKGSNWTGETITMSNKNGQDTQVYRVYENFKQSIVDHAKLLLGERYAATRKAKTVNEYVDAIAAGGYASDPDYAEKLKKIIKNNNLTAYDSDNWQGKGEVIAEQEEHEAETGEQANENLKWWGDLLVLVLTLLVGAAGIAFFLFSFKGGVLKSV